MNKIAVIGAGSWGTALAMVLAERQFNVSLYALRQEQIQEINHQHTNEHYLPGMHLSAHIHASGDLEEVLGDAAYVLIVLPTTAYRAVLREMKPYIRANTLIIHASKGLENSSFKRISEMIEEELVACNIRGVVALSGPSHAEEVSRRSPTTVVAASKDVQLAAEVQDVFITPYFRVYTNPDLIGVEIGGALKNIIALGAGLSDGLGYGDNAKAALMTRGLAEISRLGVQLGAHPLTFAGLAGLGDLIVTCTSRHSRNWRCGYALGKGKPLDEVLSAMDMVVEGVQTTKAAYELATAVQVEMPITTELYYVLFKGKSAQQAVDDLMARGKTDELESTRSKTLLHNLYEEQ